MSAGQIWESRLQGGGTPVWLLEWRLIRVLRRRLVILVDTSDSCSELEVDRRNALATIGSAKASDDRCAVWVMGRTTKAYDGVEPGAARLLEQVRGGTWIAETLSVAMAEPVAAGECAFVVVVSDGEIFDGEQLQSRLEQLQPRVKIGFLRIGSRESRFLDVMRAFTTELRSGDDLKHFLYCPTPDVTLHLGGWSGVRAVRYDGEGKLIENEPDLVTIDPAQKYVRVAMIGGDRPWPQLTYRTDGTSWIDKDVTVAPLDNDAPSHLREVIRRLSGDRLEWNYQALCLLVSARGEVPLHCPHCDPDHTIVRQRQSLYCDVCSGLLVTTTAVRHSDLPDKLRDFVRFAIVNGKPQIPPEPTEPETDLAFEVKMDADGRPWLVLDFRP